MGSGDTRELSGTWRSECHITCGTDLTGQGLDIIIPDALDRAVLQPGKMIDNERDRKIHVILHEEEGYEEVGDRQSKGDRAFDMLIHCRPGISGLDLPDPANTNPGLPGELLLRDMGMSAALLDGLAGQELDLVQQFMAMRCIFAVSGHVQDSLKPAQKLSCVARDAYCWCVPHQ